jgi:competence protein ComEC
MSKRKIIDENNIKNKPANKIRSGILIRSIIFLLISILLASTFFIKDKIENFVNFSYNQNALSTTIDENGLKIHFIDVGQADATLIEFPNNEIMLIDCGDISATSHSKFVEYLENINFKIEDGEKVIDYLILTHPDADHIGGAEYILDNFKVKNCYRPDIYALDEELPEDTLLITQLISGSAGTMYANIISKMKQEVDTPIKIIQELEIASNGYDPEEAKNNPLHWIINFYAPIASELPYQISNDYTRPIANDYSPIMILSYLDKQIMFTGDASDSVEKDFIDFYSQLEYSYIDFDVDILKLGHHGSGSSTCEDFLNFIDPEFAIASSGLNNQYGHPSTKTLERLNDYGISSDCIYRTDLNGNIVLGVSQDGQLSLIADYLQYSTFWFEWWLIYLIAELILIIIIYSIYLKYFSKKYKKILNKNKLNK